MVPFFRRLAACVFHGSVVRPTPTHLARTAVVFLLLKLTVSGAEPSSADSVEFNRDIRPLLSDRCFTCHGPDSASREADLRLDQRGVAIETGAITPGSPDDSEMWLRVISDDEDYRMPPKSSRRRRLNSAEQQLLQRWIKEGAEYELHWSLLPPRRPAVPRVDREAWCDNAIDSFVSRQHERRGLQPSTPADKTTLVRRLYADLVGMPPAPHVVERYRADERPDAYERLVERLLASPLFGERMAVYWLDLVRFANSVGYHGDQEHAIDPYREYVIDAFNDNLSFDRFTIEQLAGDLLPNPTTEQRIASGYNRLLQTSHEGGVQVKEYLSKYAADRVRNLSSTWMGATLGCAECHDHKFDSYTQKDFYRLAAFFADVDDSQTFRGSNAVLTERKPELVVLSRTDRERLRQLREKLEAPNGGNDRAHRERRQMLTRQIERLQKRAQRTMVTVPVDPRITRVLDRGDWMDESGEVVPPDVPDCLPPMSVQGRVATRLDLARWLTSPDHPQTARVFVNRLWYLLTGEGLSRNLDDNGSQGEWPTHPELLDWLATEFVDSGWDIKHVVRLVVTSRTYRQTSRRSPDARISDPDNRWLTGANRFRLPAEFIRDALLTISGLLVRETGGPAARPNQPAGYYQHLNFPTREYRADDDKNQYRRGVHVHWQRQYLHPMLKSFDAPSREECTAMRPRSNTPQAALTMLNDPNAVEAAVWFAARIITEGGESDLDKIRWAWRQATSRAADVEIPVLESLVVQHRDRYALDPLAAKMLIDDAVGDRFSTIPSIELAAWTSVARVILNLNEIITRI